MVEDNIVTNLDLNKASKEELIERIQELQKQVKQLRKRRAIDEKKSRVTKKQRQGIKARPFDFSLHPRRHVALKITYLGWDYQGFASQDVSDGSIEAHLFKALIRAKLIECRSTANYHRCGRTDKGVSAFSQVISIDLRCRQIEGIGVIPNPTTTTHGKLDAEELDYCRILNSLLPKEIRVLAWCPVRQGFSARFDCDRRAYKYYFPKVDLDFEQMRKACEYFLGEHDFRNFCKLDSTGEKSTTRNIFSLELGYCDETEMTEDEYRLCFVKVTGKAFVWHQIRCIVAVLILVGQGHEEPEIVQKLLDITNFPNKPQYAMAIDVPLILFDVDHGEDIQWIYSEDNVVHTLGDFQRLWVENTVKSQMVLDVIRNFQKDVAEAKKKAICGNTSPSSIPTTFAIPKDQLNSITMGSKAKVYTKLLDRDVCFRTPVPRKPE